MTEFEKLVQQRRGATRRGRPSVLTAEQRAERKALANAKNRLRNEARRRAHIVLQYKYNDEFDRILAEELKNLAKNDPRYSSTPL